MEVPFLFEEPVLHVGRMRMLGKVMVSLRKATFGAACLGVVALALSGCSSMRQPAGDDGTAEPFSSLPPIPDGQGVQARRLVATLVDDEARFGCFDAGCETATSSGWSPSGRHILEAKQLLSELGYGPFRQDLQNEPALGAALGDFQAKAGLADRGELTLDTLQLLRVVADYRSSVDAVSTQSSFDAVDALVAEGRAAFAAGDYKTSTAKLEAAWTGLARLSLAPGRAPSPTRRTQLANIGGELAWNSIFHRSFAQAELFARAALDLAPEQTWIQGNLAYAIMFQNREAEAAAIHEQYRDTALFSGSVAWVDAVKGDFDLLRAAGLEHPQMRSILTTLEPVEQTGGSVTIETL